MAILSLASGDIAQASTLDFAPLTELSPKLERKSKLLARRFDLVLARHRASLQRANERCQSGERAACRLETWQEFLTDISDRDEAGQIFRVHRYLNHYRYVTDRRNWHRGDYWAAPEELFARGGDCEDYAIAKYLSLRALGIPAERLRVVVVYDRNRHEEHAVLAILGPEETLILDNYFRRVRTWADMRDRYKPEYSLNELSVWMHETS